MTERDPRQELLAAARAAGFDADMDMPDSVLIAEYRNFCSAGSEYDKFADALAADLAAKARTPVTRATCAAMARAAADLKALAVFGKNAHEVLAILGLAAAKLEMKASPDG